MHVLRHGAGVAWHHEIKTVPEGIPKGKGSDEAMVEARRETERVRRMRRRERQRANRRRSGRPAKAGVGMKEAGEAMLAGLARRVSFIEKALALGRAIHEPGNLYRTPLDPHISDVD